MKEPRKRISSSLFFLFCSRVEAMVVLQQANKGLVSLRHYVESHNGRISDDVNRLLCSRSICFFFFFFLSDASTGFRYGPLAYSNTDRFSS